MPLELRADFLFGFYQGHSASGAVEDVPSPRRLHDALLAGACSLERLEGRHPDKGLDPLDQRLFLWLEENPPDAVKLPVTIPQASAAIAYRNKGLIEKGADGRLKSCVADERSYLDGPVAWYWDCPPASELLVRLEAVAQEVPYLGESDSRVILGVREVPEVAAGALRRCDPSFDARDFVAADVGHVEELVKFHADRLRVPPRDRSKATEEEVAFPTAFTKTRDVYYRDDAQMATTHDAPWTYGYALRVEGRHLVREEFVRCAVSLHRALVARFGDALPKVLQRANAMPLANCLAIQVIPAGAPANVLDDGTGGHDYVVVMIPGHAPDGEEAQIVRALSGISSLYDRHMGSLNVTFTGERVDLGHFWRPAPDGTRRLFATEPLFIPDSRPPLSGHGGAGARWTVDDDARVAFAHVWRDRGFVAQASGDRGRVELSHAVAAAGVSVFGGRVVPTARVRDFVHHANRGSALVAERATVDMTALGRDECLCAIGQTRHLGGGLLVPIDVPDPAAHRHGGEAEKDDD